MSAAIAQISLEDLGQPLFDVTFCVIDLETTGGSPQQCSITEIGAVKYRGGEEIGAFHTLVDPGTSIPPSIVILTGITEAMVVNAPRIEAVLPSLLEFVGGCIIVGHNIRFDLSFLDVAATRLGYGKLANKSVDTAALARRLVRPEVRNLRLQTLARHFRSPVAPNHRALDDAKATAHVFHGLLERAGTLGVTGLDDLLQLPTARGSPHFRKIGLVEQLPRAPGVYLFRDCHGVVIYVGKASNLRTRVRQYFYGDTRRRIENLMRELASVDYEVCPTTLEAEVAELRLIHAHRPRHNRRSRPPRTSHFIKLTDEPFPRLSVVRSVKPNGIAYLGPFRSRGATELVVTAIWDAIPIRRCSGRAGGRPAPCAPAQLGVAFCPCDGTLSRDAYQEVVDELVRAICLQPGSLLQHLEERIATLAASLRYEEAALTRDRHRALAAALDARRVWTALAEAGTILAENGQGEKALVEWGRLTATWTDRQPLRPVPAPPQSMEVPQDVAAAEEARLIWKWLNQGQVMLHEGALALPATPIKRI